MGTFRDGEPGVLERVWQAGLMQYDESVGIGWEWQAMDGAMTQVPAGGEGAGPNPTDRGESGTKRNLLAERKGIPLAAAVDGANRHDTKTTKGTLQALVIARPELALRFGSTWVWTGA